MKSGGVSSSAPSTLILLVARASVITMSNLIFVCDLLWSSPDISDVFLTTSAAFDD